MKILSKPRIEFNNIVGFGNMTGLKKTSNIIALFSAIISLVAMAVSIRSCYLADKSFVLAEREYKSNRYLVLKGTFDNEAKEVQFIPINENTLLQKVTVFFPSEIIDQEWEVYSPDYKMALVVLENNLQRFLKKKNQTPKNHVGIAVDATIPIIIDTFYTTKGVTIPDRALYFLKFDIFDYPEKKKWPDITFKDISFITRLAGRQKPVEYLDELISNSNIIITGRYLD